MRASLHGLVLTACFIARIAMAQSDGFFDTSFAGTGYLAFVGDNENPSATSHVGKIVSAGNGNILLGGDASSATDAGYWWVGELSASGAFVSTFGDTDGSGLITECKLFSPASCPNDSKYDFALQTDGRVVVVSSQQLARTNATASALDASGVTGGTGHVANSFPINNMGGVMNAGDNGGIALAANGQLFVVGYGFLSEPVYAQYGIVRLDVDLSLDTSFNAITVNGATYAGGEFIDMGTTAEGYQVGQMPDGRIMMLGSNGYRNILLGRLNADASLDTTFGGTGTVVSSSVPADVANEGVPLRGGLLDRAGRVVFVINGYSLTGFLYGALVTRFNSDGTQDTNFGTSGWSFNYSFPACPNGGFQPSELAIDSAGRILVAGLCDSEFGVIRLRGDNGALDTTFATNGLASGKFDSTSNSDAANAVTFDTAGHLLIGGSTRPAGGNPEAAVARLTYDLIYTSDFETAPRGCLPPDCN
jgi:uncharacterized delta-60 repeat protein